MGSEVERARGTGWRIWDLHVHTPASIENGYGGDRDDVWGRYLDELESLPSDVGVVGINDYWFLDGYRRVRAAREEGRLSNLDEIFPVVEMRLDQFGGTDGDLSRVNLHVIFDPDISVDVIEAQFLNALSSRVRLSPDADALDWRGVITRDALIDLGRQVKASVPQERLSEYDSDLKEGFNNLNVSLDAVQEVLSSHFFQGRALLGIGKAEWANVRWNDQSIAAKKRVINASRVVFTAFGDVSTWTAQVEKLRADNVTYQLLDCSDAHHFADSPNKDRLGNCLTWMNTTPTFAGLVHALEEFDRRVFVGLEPPSLGRIRTNPERFISSVAIKSEDPGNKLFNYSLPLNPGFVAIVGNKGQGKSALLDCIALAGNSSRGREFAFLNPSRFLNPANRRTADEYYSELEWSSGATRRVKLSDQHDGSAPVYVEYLPQAFVERVCNADPAAGDEDEFEQELRAVLFTHISEQDRDGTSSFDELLAQKTWSTQADIQRIREVLRSSITEYLATASFRASNTLSEVDGRLSLKRAEVEAAQQAVEEARQALAEIDAMRADDDTLAALTKRSEEIEAARSELIRKKAANEQRQGSIRQAVAAMGAANLRTDALRADVATLNAEVSELLGSGEPYVVLSINDARYREWRATNEQALVDAADEHASLADEIALLDRQRQSNAEELAAADSARERARQHLLQSEERLAALRGDENDLESLSGLTKLRERIEAAPAEMEQIRERMLLLAGETHEALRAQLGEVESLYGPASSFIAESEVLRTAGLEFNAELRVLPSWANISSGLDGRRNGDFPEWLDNLPQRIEGTTWEQLRDELTEVLTRLECERGEVGAQFRDPQHALKGAVSADEFLMNIFDLSWLEVRFGLTGDGQPLSQLSPGQRGLVLALFYLVIDRRTTPLLLDQPEENLDNATIATKLVPAIHEAAGRRQTIVVTHNANLAVVGDADQIVHCRKLDGKFSVRSGSISEVGIAQFSLDVLEGTKPAFDNRRHKYEAFPGLL
ncbi:TrlF family AAA-like ATPase [Mycolicibacterium goodii]|uniref:TrlF family AAA-like ATPase n=1 Tax=Mycolicibacterium goodii TaxID=134601 RepID=UPI001BDD988C|nr:AAA family ATPase [Mycolicibacterium goodii]MBU8832244.1 chromosome segregation protein SMC [Mycolicibacterium goodii]